MLLFGKVLFRARAPSWERCHFRLHGPLLLTIRKFYILIIMSNSMKASAPEAGSSGTVPSEPAEVSKKIRFVPLGTKQMIRFH